MKTIERYVFGAFLSSFLLAFLVLSFVLTIGLMVQIAGYMIQGLPADLVGRFAMVSFPETLQWTIPLGLLVASVLVFSRLSADSEVAAMRSCGIHLGTVMRWPMFFAFVATLFGLFINNEIVPRGHEIRRNLARRISVGAGLGLLEPGKVIEDFPGVKIYFDSRDGNCLHDLVVLDYSNPKCDRMITAASAVVSEEGRNIALDLRDMTVDPLDETHPGMARASRFSYVVKDALKDVNYKRKGKDFRFFEISEEISRAKTQISNASGSSRLRGTERNLAKRKLSELRTEFQRRWVFAFASVCFVLVGVPLGIRAQRRESSIGMAISLGVALSYYLVVILMTSLEKTFYVRPDCLMWLPVLICVILAMLLIPKNL